MARNEWDGNGGAILYRCNPETFNERKCVVSLIENQFENNQAVHKGGAVRYENEDFTQVDLLLPADTNVDSTDAPLGLLLLRDLDDRESDELEQ